MIKFAVFEKMQFQMVPLDKGSETPSLNVLAITNCVDGIGMVYFKDKDQTAFVTSPHLLSGQSITIGNDSPNRKAEVAQDLIGRLDLQVGEIVRHPVSRGGSVRISVRENDPTSSFECYIPNLDPTSSSLMGRKVVVWMNFQPECLYDQQQQHVLCARTSQGFWDPLSLSQEIPNGTKATINSEQPDYEEKK